jgi:hypothetical protein
VRTTLGIDPALSVGEGDIPSIGADPPRAVEDFGNVVGAVTAAGAVPGHWFSYLLAGW